MKLVAKQHLHLADEYAKRKSLRYREIAQGEEFDIQNEEADPLLRRGLAEKPAEAKEKAAEAKKTQDAAAKAAAK